ncbi:LppP/LprE family lipoprotein [Mycobacterium sp. Lab-001]|uniref:LppP/LprE family lipoprotein n=1 Tax=Mycobacterium sp. Lab-001 TaxID=3410136 RepID=UPI003D16E0B1
MRRLAAILLILAAAACGSNQVSSPSRTPAACKDSEGPSDDTVRRAVASVPIAIPGTTWVEIARGHTGNCRLHWVQLIPTIASESTPQQLIFFDHNIPLGEPTPNPKPYITVLKPSDDTVTVQYQWRVGNDEPCCPSGHGVVKFQIGPNGKLNTLGKVPNQ